MVLFTRNAHKPETAIKNLNNKKEFKKLALSVGVKITNPFE